MLAPATARAVSAAGAIDKVLVAWQPLYRDSIQVQLTFANGNTFGGFASAVVSSRVPRVLGNVASNGRDYVVTYASEERIWTGYISDAGRPQAVHAVGTTGNISSSSPRVASNSLGYYLTWIDGGRLLGLRLDDFGNNSITTTPRVLLDGGVEAVAIAANTNDYFVLAAAGGALYAIPVNASGEAFAPVKVADAIEGAPVVSWDGSSFVAFWRDGESVWSRSLEASGRPRGERHAVAPALTPLAATRELLLLTDGSAVYDVPLGFGGVSTGSPVHLPLDVPGGVATVANAATPYIVVAQPMLTGIPTNLSVFQTRQLAADVSEQHAVDIVRAGGGYVMSWLEESGELRTSRIVSGRYIDGHGVPVAQNVTRYAIATNGTDVELAWGDDVQDLVWSGTQFVKITGDTTARAAATRSGYVVVRGNVATAYAPDGTPRNSTTISGAGELLDVASDGDARVIALFRHATVVLSDDASIVRPLQELSLDATRVGWSGLSFLATRGATAARFSPDGLLRGIDPLFAANTPPSETAVAVGALGYLRSLTDYHFGDAEHVMFRTLREPTPRRRGIR